MPPFRTSLRSGPLYSNPTGYGYGRTKPKAWQAEQAAGARAGLRA